MDGHAGYADDYFHAGRMVVTDTLRHALWYDSLIGAFTELFIFLLELSFHRRPAARVF